MSPGCDSTPIRPFVSFILMTGLVIALAGMVVVAPTAQAAEHRLMVSRSTDGPWHSHLSTPLFHRVGPLVPLDEATTAFYIKNNSLDFARATVSWAVSGARDHLAQSLRFSAVVGGSSATTEPSSACGSQVSGPRIPPGGIQRIDLEMRVADMSGSRSMGQTANVNLELHLAQVVGEVTRDLCTTPTTPDACLPVVGNGCPGTVDGTKSAAPGAPVPPAVDAGVAGEAGRAPSEGVRDAGAFGLALAAFLLGVLLLVAHRRRVDAQPAADPRLR